MMPCLITWLRGVSRPPGYFPTASSSHPVVLERSYPVLPTLKDVGICASPPGGGRMYTNCIESFYTVHCHFNQLLLLLLFSFLSVWTQVYLFYTWAIVTQ